MQNLWNLSVIKQVLAQHHFQFSKQLGQNFLINPSVCPKIAEMGHAQDSFAIEIGPGIGVLTTELAKRAKKVTAIELDSRLLEVLQQTLAEFSNVEILHADVLKTDLQQLIQEKSDGLPVCVCANLPYYITSPVLMYLLQSKLPIRFITVMVQKEAAQRICAAPGTRMTGAISLAVRYYSKPRYLFSVSRGSFYPAPKVDSAVIQLELLDQPPVDIPSENELFALIRAAFSQRRKMLINPVSGALNIPKAQLKEIMQSVGISPNARAEQLSLEDFAALSRCIHAKF